MKKFWAILLSVLIGMSLPAMAENGYIGNMQVVNCDEWISMRAEPDSSSERLLKIPLGAVVTDCYWYSQSFIYATYEGVSGYILSEYVQKIAETQTESTGQDMTVYGTDAKLYAEADVNASVLAEIPAGETLSNCYTYNSEFVYCEYRGMIGYVSATELVNMDTSVAAQRIDETHFMHAERVYGDYDETMTVRVDDADGNTVWQTTLYQPNATELDSTCAFVNNKNGAAMVMLYNAAEGLSAANALTGEILWTLSTETVDLGAGICYAVDGYGTMYIGGFYGPDPVAISRDGEVLWQSDSGRDDVSWLYKITLDEVDGVIAAYDMIGDGAGSISYGWNGDVQWVVSA